MWCNKCNVLMSISGTLYEQKRKNDKGYLRYDECPICHRKKYNNGLNIQEAMNKKNQKKEVDNIHI